MTSPERERWAEQRRLERRARRRGQYQLGLRPLAVAAWNISKEHNVGSLVRTAHAVAAEEVLLVGTRNWNVEAARTSEQYTRVTHLDSVTALVAHIAARDLKLVAVELDPRAVSLFDADYPDRPCFVLGPELGGLPEDILTAAELIVQIPQWGLVPSLNLAVAGSIVLYDCLAKLHRQGRLDRPNGGLVSD
jgi:tRNA G18 (ribose-2'-O)-methylase SpoU